MSAGLSPLAMQAKRLIDATWLNRPPYDLSSLAAEALESAQMLQSPETAAERAAAEVAVRVAEETLAELKREHAENARLRERIAELEALTPAAVQTCRECGAGYSYGEPCSQCVFEAHMAAAAAAGIEDPHDSPLHHAYRLGRDLPEAGAQ
ncbi:hypothetical protein [Streptomyces sp. NPDC053367]|uniref:hypothetical protein n=1 Tax=Streptomyces sp. NPDC053367 TaxID=3365700 RepID=UPI0037D50E65